MALSVDARKFKSAWANGWRPPSRRARSGSNGAGPRGPAGGTAAQKGRRRGDKSELSPEDLELLIMRDRLLERFTIMQADLGGAFYEMAIRDHVKLDVLTRKAAELQGVDVELGEIEEKLQVARSEAGMACPNCGAEVGPGAAFCSSCGHELERREP